ncbi:bone marrow stromal antigen 2 [Rattus rattus]|uniref:bone marrow stromal antigen 2 n=1 Tax=Rattus rattus TaxID=10117 RepID=UPI0013F3282D|nr:bone marrow stromal antigen 2 [Rattus rattus]
MAPSFYHYLPVAMDERWEPKGWSIRRWWLVAAILVVLIGVVLVCLIVYFANAAHSEACKNGLRLQDECRNTTHLLKHQLTRAQDSLLQMEMQANSCNQTMMDLRDSLKKKVSQTQEQQACIKELERRRDKIEKLNQELENLRTQKEISTTVQVNSGGSVVVSSLLVLVAVLFLHF